MDSISWIGRLGRVFKNAAGLRIDTNFAYGQFTLCAKASQYLVQPYFSRLIYAAMSAASVRERFMFGIFACGSSRNRTVPVSVNPGLLAISSNGGAHQHRLGVE
jgi:hypothetical protein